MSGVERRWNSRASRLLSGKEDKGFYFLCPIGRHYGSCLQAPKHFNRLEILLTLKSSFFSFPVKSRNTNTQPWFHPFGRKNNLKNNQKFLFLKYASIFANTVLLRKALNLKNKLQFWVLFLSIPQYNFRRQICSFGCSINVESSLIMNGRFPGVPLSVMVRFGHLGPVPFRSRPHLGSFPVGDRPFTKLVRFSALYIFKASPQKLRLSSTFCIHRRFVKNQKLVYFHRWHPTKTRINPT